MNVDLPLQYDNLKFGSYLPGTITLSIATALCCNYVVLVGENFIVLKLFASILTHGTPYFVTFGNSHILKNGFRCGDAVYRVKSSPNSRSRRC